MGDTDGTHRGKRHELGHRHSASLRVSGGRGRGEPGSGCDRGAAGGVVDQGNIVRWFNYARNHANKYSKYGLLVFDCLWMGVWQQAGFFKCEVVKLGSRGDTVVLAHVYPCCLRVRIWQSAGVDCKYCATVLLGFRAREL